MAKGEGGELRMIEQSVGAALWLSVERLNEGYWICLAFLSWWEVSVRVSCCGATFTFSSVVSLSNECTDSYKIGIAYFGQWIVLVTAAGFLACSARKRRMNYCQLIAFIYFFAPSRECENGMHCEGHN